MQCVCVWRGGGGGGRWAFWEAVPGPCMGGHACLFRGHFLGPLWSRSHMSFNSKRIPERSVSPKLDLDYPCAPWGKQRTLFSFTGKNKNVN